MANNITVKDANSNNIVIHTVEDSTSAHYNMSIPITTSGGLMFDSVPGNVSIVGGTLVASIADNAPVSVRGGVLGAVSLGGGTANIGTVSISPTQANIPVSVAGGSIVATIADNAPVSVHGGVLGAVSLGGGSAHIGSVSVFVDQVPFNVSVNNSLPIPVSIVGGRVSISGISQVSVAPQTLIVHVCNALPAAGATPTVSVGGAVSLQAVQIAGVDSAGNARSPLMDTTGAFVITSIKDDVSIAPQTLLVHVCNALPAAGATQVVSVGGAASVQAIQIGAVDGSGNIRTPLTDTSGRLVITSIVDDVSLAPQTLTINDNAPVSVRGGRVSIADGTLAVTQSGTWTVQPGNTANTTPWLVSVNGQVSLAAGVDKRVIGAVSVADATLAVTQSGTWNTNASVVGRVSIFNDQTPLNVSVNNLLPVHVSLAGGPTFSTPSADDLSTGLKTLYTTNFNYIYDTAGDNWDRWDGKVSIGNTLPVPVSIVGGRVSIQGISQVSVAPQTLFVHVCNALPAAGATQLVSVAGAVSTQAVQVAFTDGTNARTPLTDTTGAIVVTSIKDDVSIAPQLLTVHVCNSLPAAGATQVVSVGGFATVQAVQIAGTDGNNVRIPLTNLSGNFLVHVCNASDISLAENAPVSVHGGVLGAVSLGGGSANIGTVSISPTQANIPVSLAPPTYNVPVSLHPVSQSGTWTVQPGNTANTTPWLVSVGGNVSLTDNAPVSVRGGVLGAVSLGGGTAQVGRVSVFVDQVPFNVSINNSLPVPVSIVGGRVSISGISQVSVAGLVTVNPPTNTGSAVPAGAFMVGGTDGTNLRALLLDALGAQKMSGFVTNAEASFTRPTDTVAYVTNDLVANTTVNSAVTPMTFNVSRFATGGGAIMVRRAKVVKSDGDLTNAQFRIHLYNTSNGVTNQGVSVAGGDNVNYVATQVSNYLGFLSVACQTSHSNGAVGWGGPHKGMEINAVLGATQFTIQGLLQAQAAYTPSSAERFNVTLEVYQD